MTTISREPSRAVLRVAGAEAESFLQGLLSNDVSRATADQAVYAALLTPQGKLLADFFVWRVADGFLLDAPAAEIAAVVKRLAMYKLRAAVEIAECGDLAVAVSEAAIAGARAGGADPREPRLGARAVMAAEAVSDEPEALEAYHRRRLAAGAPEFGADLTPNDSYILEFDFERLQGVDFKKGCYVGQEVTARMRHKTELRRGLFRVALDGAAGAGAEIVDAGGKPAGRLGSTALGPDGVIVGLALLRKDRVEAGLKVGAAALRVMGPAGG